MDTFAILGFTFGTMGFIFAISSYTQIGELKKRVLKLESLIEKEEEKDA